MCVCVCGGGGGGGCQQEQFALRRGKLNSQFIVTRFSVLHAGGRSLFRFHISPTDTFSMIARDKKTHNTVFTSLQGPKEVASDLDRYQRSVIMVAPPSITRTIGGDFEI